ncbi:hypothetical protein DTO027B5_4244 [Paecilomyces variotii]|nr:hypothetical protein DTO027B3_4679 [Paecilomyces variotii]KAJ9333897.1 hypothetical protein DTO027B5_4244 [Paecilomyces variotii]KAJ9403719.1 hypothetical protein DTO045G8_8528 [Paecilomyces variotii]
MITNNDNLECCEIEYSRRQKHGESAVNGVSGAMAIEVFPPKVLLLIVPRVTALGSGMPLVTAWVSKLLAASPATHSPRAYQRPSVGRKLLAAARFTCRERWPLAVSACLLILGSSD